MLVAMVRLPALERPPDWSVDRETPGADLIWRHADGLVALSASSRRLSAEHETWLAAEMQQLRDILPDPTITELAAPTGWTRLDLRFTRDGQAWQQQLLLRRREGRLDAIALSGPVDPANPDAPLPLLDGLLASLSAGRLPSGLQWLAHNP